MGYAAGKQWISRKLAKKDKMYLTEIMNDLYKNGFVQYGKADTMLRDWSKELRTKARPVLPPSKLHRMFNKEVGSQQWR